MTRRVKNVDWIFTAGLITAIVGIPLYVIGTKQVPVQRASQRLLPAVSIGTHDASLRWTF